MSDDDGNEIICPGCRHWPCTCTRILHCWHDGPSILDCIEAGRDFDIENFVGSTCMLEKGHEGPHEYTPDDQIGVSFAKDAP